MDLKHEPVIYNYHPIGHGKWDHETSSQLAQIKGQEDIGHFIFTSKVALQNTAKEAKEPYVI